jgi:bifunctional DNA-binding transcriptional regulator/antitoxin component of YhaV-PrlF toxin-antitoxin module
MATTQYKLFIGAKRQLTIPADCMNRLSLEKGGELLLEIVGDHAVLLPVVSIPRRDLPEELRVKFEARRGKKASDIPLGEFLGELAAKPEEKTKSGRRAATGSKKRIA